MEPSGQDANDHGQNSVGDGEHPWEVTDMTRLRRFICYGSEMAIYDTKEHRLGMESALALLSLLQEGRGCEVVEEVKRLALEGRPVRANPSLFALAVCSQHLDLNTRQGAFRALSDVCRAPEHLFTFIQYKKEVKERMRCGIWGRALRKAVSDWYNKQDAMGLALAVTKYKTREGWSHQDLLRLSHAKPANEAIVLISKYVMKGWKEVQGAYADKENSEEVIKVLSYLEAVEKVKHSADEMEVSHLIEEHSLEREQLLTDHLRSKVVWKALLKEMPMESMLRTLGKMTADQVLEPGSSDVAEVCERIQSEAALKKAKLHPFSVLTASENYKRGQGNRGKVKWEPNVDIIKALDSAFYKCFTNVEPAGKRFVVAVDISTSLSSIVKGTSVSTAVAAAAMTMVFARTEAETQVMAYSEGAIVPCTITEGMSLRQVATELVKIPSGYTDCALPILWASEKRITVDMFIIFTNSACWHGEANPTECLRMYRHKMGIFSKLMVCGLTSNGLSIADPAEDRGMLDLCGFDLGAIEVIRNLALDLI
ncbi:60 kDa SS-A/Ro ribonucleoprotein isoform X1 [Oncorhynchus mykiss]|uniref:RNA-binding protein RO60 n=2 Tax=Oncorhynchus mykiss TaxID=8022 RepID=A0A8C7RSE3_ONCMY|nr:60 kDa SS-A/Ro ribonucleoprotein isoform X1 [Oncorhynchus mykiss]